MFDKAIPHISTVLNVLGDGNCGFRSAAASMGFPEDHWPIIRSEMVHVLMNEPRYQDKSFMDNAWDTTFDKTLKSLQHKSGSAKTDQWFRVPDHAFLLAETYQRPVVFFSKSFSTLYAPQIKGPPLNKTSLTPICILNLEGLSHFISFKFACSIWPAPHFHHC